MVKIPEGSEYRSAWGKLDSQTRRRIVRAVNKGEALANRREAALAVATARRQQAFWKKSWLLGPLAALITLFGSSENVWVTYLANAVLSTAIIALMGYFWHRRAARAAEVNLQAAEGKRKKQRPAKGDGGKPGRNGKSGGRGHLPGRPKP